MKSELLVESKVDNSYKPKTTLMQCYEYHFILVFITLYIICVKLLTISFNSFEIRAFR